MPSLDSLPRGTIPCTCDLKDWTPLRVALTGGPGAGKTAILQLARRSLCSHVVVMPETAGIVFGGGFPRLHAANARKAIQRAIFHVQRELEAVVATQNDVALVLLDRGTIDGIAYWPDSPETYWQELGISHEQELTRYDSVIHLRTPSIAHGYNQDNVLRIENNEDALELDRKIEEAWAGHRRRQIIDSHSSFLQKATQALTSIVDHLPSSCSLVATHQLLMGT